MSRFDVVYEKGNYFVLRGDQMYELCEHVRTGVEIRAWLGHNHPDALEIAKRIIEDSLAREVAQVDEV